MDDDSPMKQLLKKSPLDAPFVQFQPDATQEELVRFMVLPMRDFATRVDGVLQRFESRLAELERKVAALESRKRPRKRKPK